MPWLIQDRLLQIEFAYRQKFWKSARDYRIFNAISADCRIFYATSADFDADRRK